jgi:hypothetical protein
MIYGGLKIFGNPIVGLKPPLKVIGEHFFDILNDVFGAKDESDKLKIRRSCVRSSSLIREYLSVVGFDAHVITVNFTLEKIDSVGTLRGIEMGGPPQGDPDIMPHGTWDVPNEKWDGHMVAITKGHLIDVTLSSVQRPWHEFPPMVAVPLSMLTGDVSTGIVIAKRQFKGVTATWRADLDRSDVPKNHTGSIDSIYVLLRLLQLTGWGIDDCLARLSEIRASPSEFLEPVTIRCRHLAITISPPGWPTSPSNAEERP